MAHDLKPPKDMDLKRPAIDADNAAMFILEHLGPLSVRLAQLVDRLVCEVKDSTGQRSCGASSVLLEEEAGPGTAPRKFVIRGKGKEFWLGL